MKEIVGIYEEMLAIYKKYMTAVLVMGTIQMSPKDTERLKELEGKLSELEKGKFCDGEVL